MIVLGNLLITLSGVVHALFQLAWWVLIARIVLSWLQPRPGNDLLRRLVDAVYELTDPVLVRLRRALPFLVVGGLDLTPIVLFVALRAADGFLTRTLAQVGYSLL